MQDALHPAPVACAAIGWAPLGDGCTEDPVGRHGLGDEHGNVCTLEAAVLCRAVQTSASPSLFEP